MNIKENNKLIALFMNDIESIDSKVSFTKSCTISDLKYHLSYDWLIPVYNKIANEELYRITDDENGIILFNIMYDRLGDACIIKEVYQSIVDFIEWYNKQKEFN